MKCVRAAGEIGKVSVKDSLLEDIIEAEACGNGMRLG